MDPTDQETPPARTSTAPNASRAPPAPTPGEPPRSAIPAKPTTTPAVERAGAHAGSEEPIDQNDPERHRPHQQSGQARRNPLHRDHDRSVPAGEQQTAGDRGDPPLRNGRALRGPSAIPRVEHGPGGEKTHRGQQQGGNGLNRPPKREVGGARDHVDRYRGGYDRDRARRGAGAVSGHGRKAHRSAGGFQRAAGQAPDDQPLMRSRYRYWSASPASRHRISSTPSRSAIVRATFRIRW